MNGEVRMGNEIGKPRQPATGRLAVSLSERVSPKPAPRWLRTLEFCALYGVTPWTARRWAKQGRVSFVRMPLSDRGRFLILDPQWTRLDPPTASDPSEWLCVLRQSDVARLLGITARGLRYLEAAGKAKFRLVGHRKLYSLSEVRRLLAQRQNGREKVTGSERRISLLRWAVWKLNPPSAAR